MTSCPSKKDFKQEINDSGKTVLLEPTRLLSEIAKIAEPAAVNAWHKATMEFRGIVTTMFAPNSCEKDNKLGNGTQELDQSSETLDS